jgi:hypothetical protein
MISPAIRRYGDDLVAGAQAKCFAESVMAIGWLAAPESQLHRSNCCRPISPA